MKIIACLGNPGKKYLKNRHNAGFIIGDYLSGEFQISVNKKSFNSVYGTGKIGDRDVLLQFPQTFMNNCGISISASLQYYQENPRNLIVIHDEIELAFGAVKTKFGGGHKGHNGIRSIIEKTGTADFHRLRLGVGRPDDPDSDVAGYVLSNFTGDELKKMEEMVPEIINQIKMLVAQDIK